METLFIVMIVILFLLAISDLIVGVSNDAVNFLVSAIGSKAASWGVIMLIASLGVLFGATFSSGMMEVARKGIFNPQMFAFNEIMIIFLAVMFTDIILLDTFNTLGLPTSTTVSIVFELLGAAIAVSLIKLGFDENSEHNLSDYINSAKALAIILGILLSVVVAFSVGMVIQFISRLIFSFKYQKTLKLYGSVWGGIAITAITYFILIKGAKGASFMHPETVIWIKTHTLVILGSAFLGWAIVLQILNSFFKINVLKVIVLFGTFALAMAFAGNDLVNFIGVPLAGLESYQLYAASNGNEDLLMSGLSKAVKTPTLYLLIAGLIMVLTLWLSKKAKNVTKTSLNLSRQDEGYERFGSTLLSRAIVRYNVRISKYFEARISKKAQVWMAKRFKQVKLEKNGEGERPAFDLVRASVNLVVSSILIAIGTSLKLPLSTTYVTFMVAMGTSLADGAWGRESAVYRVSGVLSVIGGWFVTAFMALLVSMTIASLLYFGGGIAIGVIVVFVAFLMSRTHFIHKKREQSEKELEEEHAEYFTKESAITPLIKEYNKKIANIFKTSLDILEKTFAALKKEDRKTLHKQMLKIRQIDEKSKGYKTQIHEIIANAAESDTEKVHYFVQIIDHLREYTHAVNFIVIPAYEHIENNHLGLSKKQTEELMSLHQELKTFVLNQIDSIEDLNFKKLKKLKKQQQSILENINASRLQQLKRIKLKNDKLKNSMLYIDILAEFKNLTLYSLSIIKIEASFKESLP